MLSCSLKMMIGVEMIRVKICGITALDDALAAVDAGADALGFVFAEQSPRCISPQKAAAIISGIPPFVQTVGLFVNADAERVNWVADFCGLDIIQLHGEEDQDFCNDIERRIIKAFRVKDASTLSALARYQVAGYLLDAWSPDAHGGTGKSFDWNLVREYAGNSPIILAGGLNPENVREAVNIVKPYGVDVSSGVEVSPGKKDPEKIRRFLKALQ
jgi:phosphoribosylanthranilate isomerase